MNAGRSTGATQSNACGSEPKVDASTRGDISPMLVERLRSS